MYNRKVTVLYFNIFYYIIDDRSVEFRMILSFQNVFNVVGEEIDDCGKLCDHDGKKHGIVHVRDPTWKHLWLFFFFFFFFWGGGYSITRFIRNLLYSIVVSLLEQHWGAVVDQWIRPRTLNREVLGSNLLASTVVPLGKALYPHCLVPRTGLKALGPLVACLC